MGQKFLFASLSLALVMLTPAPAQAADGFAWEDGDDETTLLFDGRPVLRYMHAPFDGSSEESVQMTMKPYHHVFSPDGETLLTKGPGGLYPHHRGLFYGFNKVTYGDDQHCDVWHCTDGAYQEHQGEQEREADEDSAKHRLVIEWHGRDGVLFALEERELAVTRPTYNDVEGWQIDFTSHVTTTDGKPIHLDGDPQHAGFHFRAAQEVADVTAKQTYYLRTDGKGEPGETRNWDQDDPDSDVSAECVNRPWNAMSFIVDGRRFTALYLDHSSNPKPSRYSERDYGRFGSYFLADVTEGMPLNVQYRVWVQDGEMTVEDCQKLSADFNAEGTVLPAEGVAQ
jgi:hypothetical protein